MKDNQQGATAITTNYNHKVVIYPERYTRTYFITVLIHKQADVKRQLLYTQNAQENYLNMTNNRKQYAFK